MTIRAPNLVITNVDTITAFDPTTGSYKWTLEEIESVSISQEETITEILGRKGRTTQLLKQNKTVRIAATNGYVSTDLMTTQAGGDSAVKLTQIAWADYLVVQNGTAITTQRAYGTVGAEITSLHIRLPNGVLGTQLQQDSSPGIGKFAYDPATKALSFASDVADGTVIVARYRRRILADVVSSYIGRGAGRLSLYIDALAQDKCGNMYRVQIHMPKADFSGNFTLDFGGDQTMHSFEAIALPGGCGKKEDLWSYTIYGAAGSENGNIPLYLGIGQLDINSVG